MKVLVVSDSHGRRELLDRIISAEPDCMEIIFLGDGIRDIEIIREFYPDRKFTCVRGNNDRDYTVSSEAYKHFNGVTLVACHGDTYGVRSTLRSLFSKAASVKAELALYGHTHIAYETKDPLTGVVALNPGAVCDGRYCVIDFSGGKFTARSKSCYNE